MEELRQEKQQAIRYLMKIQNMLMVVTCLLMFLFFYCLYCCIVKEMLQIMLVICLLLFVIIGMINLKINDCRKICQQYLKIINEYDMRKQMKISEFSTGIDFTHSICLEDLNILGINSIFQYINIGKSKQGKEKLIQRFENTNNDLDLFHGMIQEIIQYPQWIIEFQTHFQNCDFTLLLKSIKKTQKKSRFLALDLFLDLITLILVIYFLGQSKITAAFLSLLIHYLISLAYSHYYSDYFNLYKSIIQMINGILYDNFPDFKNVQLKRLADSYSKHTAHFHKIETVDTLLAMEHNILSSIPGNAFFSLKLLIVYMINKLLDLHQLQDWIDEYTDFEMLLSLSVIPMIRDDICVPQIGNHFEINDGIFPLIEKCTANSFEYRQTTIITGSNMSGKTSFLRMIGLNLILMNAGSYVFASKMISPIYRIYTSINVQDDLNNGISTFYGELLRIAEANEYEGAIALLIDEIFKGTNYNDRITGAKSIIEKMSKRAMMLITTHDFELCNLSDVDNYYFQEQYMNDRISFDYSIKKGKSKKTNALYLMRKLKLIE